MPEAGTDKLGPVRIRQPRLARNGTGRPGNFTTRVHQVPPHFLSMLWSPDGKWRTPDGGSQMPGRGWRMPGGWRVGGEVGGCVRGKNSEPLAQEYPDVPVEENQEPKKAPNKANLEST